MSKLDEYIPKSITISTENITDRIYSVKEKIEQKDSLLRGVVVSLLLLFIFGSRIQSWYLGPIKLPPKKVLFTNTAGFESFRGVQYILENFPIPLVHDTLYNYPMEVGHMTGGMTDILLTGPVFILSLFFSVKQSVVLTIYFIGPVFAVLTGYLLYKLGKEIFSSDVALVSLLIYSLIPGRFIQDTLLGSGRKISVYMALFLASLLSILYIIRYARESIFVREVLTEELAGWNQYTKYLLILSVISFIFVLSDPINVFLYYGMVLLIVGHYISIGTKFKNEVPESIPLSLIIPTIIPTLGILAVSFITPLYTTEHIVISIGSVMLLAVFANAERLAEKYNISSYRLSVSIIGSVLFITLISLIQYTPFTEVIQSLSSAPTQDYSDQIISLFESNVRSTLIQNFGVFSLISISGFILYYVKKVTPSTKSDISEESLVIVSLGILSIFVSIISINWISFVILGVSLFSAYFIFYVIRRANISNISISEIKAYHVIIIILIFGAFIPTLIYPTNSTVITQGQTATLTEQKWTDTARNLDKVAKNPVDPYDLLMSQPDKGVISWSGQGEDQITSISGMPVTSNTKQSTLFASEYLLASSQNEADKIAKEYNAQPQYIVLDRSTVAAQQGLSSMINRHPYKSVREYYTPVFDAQSSKLAFNVYTQEYYNSLAVRLYHYHGSRVSPQPVTVSYTSRTMQGQTVSSTFLPINRDKPHIQRFSSMSKAQNYVDKQNGVGKNVKKKPGTHQIGGVGLNPRSTVPALTEYRYVTSSPQSINNSPVFISMARRLNKYSKNLKYIDYFYEDSQVKVFEKVKGAKLRGYGGPSNKQVQITMILENTESGTKFRYKQTVKTNKNGTFTAELPYATKNLPKGITVKPTQDYQIIIRSSKLKPDKDGKLTLKTNYWYGTVSVPEIAVQNGEVIYTKVNKMSPKEFKKKIKSSNTTKKNSNSTSGN